VTLVREGDAGEHDQRAHEKVPGDRFAEDDGAEE